MNDKRPYRGKSKPFNKKKGKGYFRKKGPAAGPTTKKFYGKEKFINQYFSLYEHYLAARRKYFNSFGRDKSVKNSEISYYKALGRLREYEASLTAEQISIFKKYFPDLKQENTYTENRGIENVGKLEVMEGDIEDPHLLPSQIQSDFSTDKEESVGSIEDYKSYKGV